MPPPKKPKTKESWEEFISESQVESSIDKQDTCWLSGHKADSQHFNGLVGIEGKEPVECSDFLARPKALLNLAPEDLSVKLGRNGCLKTVSNCIPVVLKQTIIANGSVHVQDSSACAKNHPQLRNILLQASSDPILPDVGENLVSSGGGLQELHATGIHSCPSGSLNSSKILWKNSSVQASTNELQLCTAFSTNLPSAVTNLEEICLLDSNGRERKQNHPSWVQIKHAESSRFQLGRWDHSSGKMDTNTWPHVTVDRNGGCSDNSLDKTLTECNSASQINRPFDQGRRNGLGNQASLSPLASTADSTTHMIFNSNQSKRSRLQARHQAFQLHREQSSATERSVQELHARGSTTNDRVSSGQGNLDQQRSRNPAPESSSSEMKSKGQMTIARLFTELHKKDIGATPVMKYLVSLDDALPPQGENATAELILSQILPRAFQGVSRSQRPPQTLPNGRPQTDDGFCQRVVEKGSLIANKLLPASVRPPLDSRTKMATLRELLCDDSVLSVNSACARPSGGVSRVNIADSGAAHRLQETGDLGRMEDHHPWSVASNPESLENENSCEMMNADVHSSAEMPSSSSCGRNRADEKGVSRCQICDDAASGFHYGVWSCEGCKAFFKRSLHGPVEYVCPATNSCTIDKLRRKSCQACRLRKCHEAGMTAGISRKEKGVRQIGKKRKATEEKLSASDPDAASSSYFGKLTRYDSVCSSHDVDQEPSLSPVLETKHSPFPASAPSPSIVSPQPNPLVERLLAIELPPREAEFNNSISDSSLHLMSGLLELINSQLVDIITWSKALPEFSKSSLESRTRLLVASWSELLILGSTWQSVPQMNVWVCAPNLLLSRAHCKVAMIETLFDQIMLLVHTFRRLQLTKTELVLLRLTILLNSDSSIIESQPPLANLRNLLDETWQQIPPEDAKMSRSRLSHLLLTLPDIRQCSLMMHDVINSARHRQGVPMYNLLHEMLDCDVQRMSDMHASNAGAAEVE